MAFGTGRAFIYKQNKAAGDPWAPVTDAALNAGELGIIVVSKDNNSTAADGDNGEVVGVTDSAGNTWVKLKEHGNTNSSANAGCVCSVWYTIASSTLAVGGTLTMDWLGSTTAKAVVGFAFTLGAGSTITTAYSAGLSNDGADAGSMSTGTITSREYLLIRGTAQEIGTTTYTASANYTTFYGTYTAITTSGGSGGSNIGTRGEYRIATLTSDSTDPTAGGVQDHASVYLAIYELTGQDAPELRGRPFGLRGGNQMRQLIAQ